MLPQQLPRTAERVPHPELASPGAGRSGTAPAQTPASQCRGPGGRGHQRRGLGQEDHGDSGEREHLEEIREGPDRDDYYEERKVNTLSPAALIFPFQKFIPQTIVQSTRPGAPELLPHVLVLQKGVGEQVQVQQRRVGVGREGGRAGRDSPGAACG